MGMDLYPIDETNPHRISYNLAGWETLLGFLRDWGVDVTEFRGTNDGDIISAATCEVVASAIAAHLDDLPFRDRKWLTGAAEAWRQMSDLGGCRQL
jgi:hypothetical protein